MPDRKRLPARSKLTKRADLLRNAVRKNDGKRDLHVRGGIGTPATMERPKGDLSKFTKKPTSRSVLPLSEKGKATGRFRPDVKLDTSNITDLRGKNKPALKNFDKNTKGITIRKKEANRLLPGVKGSPSLSGPVEKALETAMRVIRNPLGGSTAGVPVKAALERATPKKRVLKRKAVVKKRDTVTGGPSLNRHNKSERAADPNGPTKTRVAVVRGRETTVATGPKGALSRSRVTTPKTKRKTAGLGKGLRV